MAAAPAAASAATAQTSGWRYHGLCDGPSLDALATGIASAGGHSTGSRVEPAAVGLDRAHDDLPLDSERPLVRPLARRGVEHASVDVVVELVERDVPVAVQVCVARPQSVDQHPGEDGVDALALHAPVFEGVLERVGGGDHDSASPFETLARADAASGFDSPRECTAVAAIQHQHLAARAAFAHQVVDEVGRDGRRAWAIDASIGRREVEPRALVEDAVTGEIEEDEILAAAAVEERLDLLHHLRCGLVGEGRDLEVADRRYRQHGRERPGVVTRRLELRQRGVRVARAGDDQREAAVSHRRTPLPSGARASPRSRAAVLRSTLRSGRARRRRSSR